VKRRRATPGPRRNSNGPGLALLDVPLDPKRERALNLALNNPNLQGEWDPIALAGVVSILRDAPTLLELSGYSELQVAEILSLLNPKAAPGPGLELRFGVPPFTVLDARQGYWQDRKRAWMSLGIESELGRGEKLLDFVHAARAQDRYAHPEKAKGLTYKTASVADPGFYEAKREAERRLGRSISTRDFREKFWTPGASYQSSSIFDPVLSELVVRWFSPPGGRVYDPFAGGSVRGLVSGWLGRHYTGLDLSPAQLAANEAQAARIFSPETTIAPAAPLRPLPSVTSPETPTPVERSGELWLKRDDALLVAGVRGGKVRTCWRLAHGAAGLVTAGSRSSPQVNIVAHVAKALGVPCRVHVPAGARTPELEAAAEAGAEVLGHRPGRNSVICARARADAEERGWKLIPFGMECGEAVEETASQVVRVDGVRRIVVPVGSGMTLAGVLHGLDRIGWDVPVLGVLVGADPTKRLGTYAPAWWKDERRVQLKRASTSYDEAARADLDGVVLDPHYEAKCVPFLGAGDLLWVVGIRETAEPRVTSAGSRVRPRWVEADALSYDTSPLGAVDLVFTCPPYGNLERYSDDPRDLSNMKPEAFDAAYAEAIRRTCGALAEDRFAVYVVGDYRDSSGSYRNLPGKTVAAFEAAGLRLYNEAILVTSVGSLPVRTARFFEQSRKLGKAHQNVLVFVKGDATRATAAIGPVDFGRELEGPPAAPAAEAM
jgi:DNA modification methylase